MRDDLDRFSSLLSPLQAFFTFSPAQVPPSRKLNPLLIVLLLPFSLDAVSAAAVIVDDAKAEEEDEESRVD